MAITRDEAYASLQKFVDMYPEAYSLAFVIGKTVADVYGKDEVIKKHIPENVRGAHISGKWKENGITYNGRVDLILNNHKNIKDFTETLRHEILGHYGLNTFNEEDRDALLDQVIKTQEDPAFKPYWEHISNSYPDATTKLKAEELICWISEFVEPKHHLEKSDAKEQGKKVFKETCIDRNKPITMKDLHSIVCMVAQGLHDKTRTLETVPDYQKFRTMETPFKLKTLFTPQEKKAILGQPKIQSLNLER